MSLCEMGVLKFRKKYESFKMPPNRLLVWMMSTLFVPNFAPLPFLAQLYQKHTSAELLGRLTFDYFDLKIVIL